MKKCWLYSSRVKTYVPRQLVFIDTMYQPIYFIHPGVGLLSQFPPFRYFPCFQNDQNISYLLNITFIFDRCRHSLAAVTLIKYECDLKNKYFWNIENIHNKEIHGSCSNPHPRSTLYPIKHVLIFLCALICCGCLVGSLWIYVIYLPIAIRVTWLALGQS